MAHATPTTAPEAVSTVPTLTAPQMDAIRNAVSAAVLRCHVGHAAIYGTLKRAWGVRSYHYIPSADFDNALEYVQRWGSPTIISVPVPCTPNLASTAANAPKAAPAGNNQATGEAERPRKMEVRRLAEERRQENERRLAEEARRLEAERHRLAEEERRRQEEARRDAARDKIKRKVCCLKWMPFDSPNQVEDPETRLRLIETQQKMKKLADRLCELLGEVESLTGYTAL